MSERERSIRDERESHRPPPARPALGRSPDQGPGPPLSSQAGGPEPRAEEAGVPRATTGRAEPLAWQGDAVTWPQIPSHTGGRGDLGPSRGSPWPWQEAAGGRRTGWSTGPCGRLPTAPSPPPPPLPRPREPPPLAAAMRAESGVGSRAGEVPGSGPQRGLGAGRPQRGQAGPSGRRGGTPPGLVLRVSRQRPLTHTWATPASPLGLGTSPLTNL